MQLNSTLEDRKNKQWGIIVSTMVHTVLIALILIPLLGTPSEPPLSSGILVNLGRPDQGQGDENTPGPLMPDGVGTLEAPKPRVRQTDNRAKKEKLVTTEDLEALALEQQKEQEVQERKAQAAEAARRQAEAAQFKNKIGELFGGGGQGNGKGNTGKPGNQGDPGGDPNSDRLTGISTGTGVVGDGLGNRGIVRSPKIEDNSQQTGTVVVRVCVDPTGHVTEADFTQKGSSISDARLKRIALANAKNWKFSESTVEKQCGTITYRFRVQ